MKFYRRLTLALFFVCFGAASVIIAQRPTPSVSPQPQRSPAAPPVDEWIDTFDGPSLDTTKWERFSFEGGGGGRLVVEEGQLRIRSANRSRSGVRSVRAFTGDRFIFEATVARVGPALPAPGDRSVPLGFATLCVLFDGSGRNRVEWILTSEGTFEAWSVVDGRGERLDPRNLGTRERTPTLAIVRRGDEFLFLLNGQVGLRRTIPNLPRDFRVMLYGFSSSENNWDSVRVVTLRQ